MYKKHFHDAKSWPLCCISACCHRTFLSQVVKKNPRSLELLKSEIAVTHIQIIIYCSTFVQKKASHPTAELEPPQEIFFAESRSAGFDPQNNEQNLARIDVEVATVVGRWRLAFV